MKSRNNLLDFCKIFIAIGVVFVHFQYDGYLGNILGSIGTSGVLIFFLISGYGCYGEGEANNSKKILKRTLRVTIITLISAAIYIIYTLIEAAIQGNLDWFGSLFLDPMLYVQMIFVGNFELFHADHLWFLVALIYGYLIMYLVERFKLKKTLIIALPFLILLKITMETLTNSNILWSWHFSGNAIVGALPMLALGYFIHMYEEKIVKINPYILLTLTLISLVCLFSISIYKINGIDISQIFKISTATLVFIICLKYNNVMKENFFSRFGAYGTMHFYIIHYLIGTILSWVFLANGASENFIHTWFPFVVVLVTFVISYILMEINFLITQHRFSFQKPKQEI